MIKNKFYFHLAKQKKVIAYPEDQSFTIEEYLAMEEKAEYRSEYHEGKVVALAGGSYNHNRICANVIAKLSNALSRGSCQVLTSDMKLKLVMDEKYVYPDAMVICGTIEKAESNENAVINPIVVVEVLSKSTADYDRGDKFFLYR